MGHNYGTKSLGAKNDAQKDNSSLSTQGSNVFLFVLKNRMTKKVDTQSGAPGNNLEEDQNYWPDRVRKYNDPIVFGTKISLSIGSAVNIFWEICSKLTLNTPERQFCLTFPLLTLNNITCIVCWVRPKKTNVEVWANIPPISRNKDKSLQDIREISSATISLMLQGVSGMSKHLVLYK